MHVRIDDRAGVHGIRFLDGSQRHSAIERDEPIYVLLLLRSIAEVGVTLKHLLAVLCSFRLSDTQHHRPGAQYDRDKKRSVGSRDKVHAPKGAFEQSDTPEDSDQIGRAVYNRSGDHHPSTITGGLISIVIVVGGAKGYP